MGSARSTLHAQPDAAAVRQAVHRHQATQADTAARWMPQPPSNHGALTPPNADAAASMAVPSTSSPFWFDSALTPTDAWEQLGLRLQSQPSTAAWRLDAAVSTLPVSIPQHAPAKPAGCVRFLALSDTHNRHAQLRLTPALLREWDIDVLVHSGDFTDTGLDAEIHSFARWLHALPIRHKVVIAGNHELPLDHTQDARCLASTFGHKMPIDHQRIKGTLHTDASVPLPRVHEDTDDAVTDSGSSSSSSPVWFPPASSAGGTVYLQDSGVQIRGVNIWGSPWQPWFCDWAFNLRRGSELRAKWAIIPSHTDVLLTHGPPLGFGDAEANTEQAEPTASDNGDVASAAAAPAASAATCSSSSSSPSSHPPVPVPSSPLPVRRGCVDLTLECFGRVQPRVVVSGHVHAGAGQRSGSCRQTHADTHSSSNSILLINAASCNETHRPTECSADPAHNTSLPPLNPPFVFDVAPAGADADRCP